MNRIMEANLTKGKAEWQRILKAIVTNMVNEHEIKAYNRYIAGCMKGGKAVQAVLHPYCCRHWYNRFMDLVDFYKLHGHTHVPQSNKPLGPWVLRQLGVNL